MHAELSGHRLRMGKKVWTNASIISEVAACDGAVISGHNLHNRAAAGSPKERNTSTGESKLLSCALLAQAESGENLLTQSGDGNAETMPNAHMDRDRPAVRQLQLVPCSVTEGAEHFGSSTARASQRNQSGISFRC